MWTWRPLPELVKIWCMLALCGHCMSESSYTVLLSGQFLPRAHEQGVKWSVCMSVVVVVVVGTKITRSRDLGVCVVSRASPSYSKRERVWWTELHPLVPVECTWHLLNVTLWPQNTRLPGAFCSNSRVYIARVSVKLRMYTIPTQGGKDVNGKQFLSSLRVDKSSV